MAPGNQALSVIGELRQSVLRVRARRGELITQLRGDLDTVVDPQAKALFRTTAVLLTALEQAFADVAAQSGTDPRSDSAPGKAAGHQRPGSPAGHRSSGASATPARSSASLAAGPKLGGLQGDPGRRRDPAVPLSPGAQPDAMKERASAHADAGSCRASVSTRLGVPR